MEEAKEVFETEKITPLRARRRKHRVRNAHDEIIT